MKLKARFRERYEQVRKQLSSWLLLSEKDELEAPNVKASK